MEDISSVNFFKFLSTQKIRVLVVETGIVHSEFIEALIINDEHGYTKKKAIPKNFSLPIYLQKLLEENNLKNKILHEDNNKICYIYKKGVKKLYEELKVKEIISKFKPLSQTTLIQKYVSSINESEKALTLRLHYLSNEYICEFICGKSIIKDPLTINSMIDTTTIIMSSLEQTENKRVVQLHAEYSKDREGALWLVNVAKCKLIEAKYTIEHPITSKEDLDTLQKIIPKTTKNALNPRLPKISKYYETKNNTKTVSNEKYVFKRGQIRNIDSNLDSPIRFNSHECGSDGQAFDSSKIEVTENKIRSSTSTKLLTSSHKDFKPRDNIGKNTKTNKNEFFFKYLSARQQNFEEIDLENKNQDKSPLDHKKSLFSRKLHHNTIKTQPKVLKSMKIDSYGDNFVELVMRTYCKEKKIESEYFPQEFGITTNLSTEEFTQFINSMESPREDSSKGRLTLKPTKGETFLSLSQAPKNGFPRRKFEMHFISSILAKRVELFSKIPKNKPTREENFLSLLIKSPRSKQIQNTTKN